MSALSEYRRKIASAVEKDDVATLMAIDGEIRQIAWNPAYRKEAVELAAGAHAAAESISGQAMPRAPLWPSYADGGGKIHRAVD